MAPKVWLMIGIILGIIEVFTSGFWFLWLAAASLLVALGATLHLVRSFAAQVLLFAFFTAFFLIFTRPLVMKLFKTKDVKSNVDSLVGKTAVVVQEIAPLKTGQVKIYGEIWTAVSDETIKPGEHVVIQSVEGVKLIVKPATF